MTADPVDSDPGARRAAVSGVVADCLSRRAAGESLGDARVIAEHPGLMPELGEELARLAAHGGVTSASHAETVSDLPPAPDGGSHGSIPGYRIERKLSEGGQGVVYLAVQESTRRKVALKMMRGGALTGPGEKARFDREVQVLAHLSHPNIVAIHDSGTLLGGHFFVMDYIAGQPLDQYMQGPTAPREIRETLRLFGKICAAIHAAHLAGIIHRDLKPSNILVDAGGEPHVLDFGLAKVPLSDQEATLMTMTGLFVGSLPWASPEQAEASHGGVDVRTDVYSLGVIVFQMLTGCFPYDVTGDLHQVQQRIVRAEPRRPRTLRREIDDEAETIILKCLSKDRERRYQSAGELARDIQNYLDDLPIEAKRDSIGYLVRKQLRRHRIPVAVTAGFLVLIVAGLVTSVALWRRAVVEGATARFHLETARREVNLSYDEFGDVIRRLRRAEDRLALSSASRPVAVEESEGTVCREPSAWISNLLPVPEETGVGGAGKLEPKIADAIARCSRNPADPACNAAFAWLRENRDRVASLSLGCRRLAFRFGSKYEGADLLIQRLLPMLSHVRFAGRVLVASALLHNRESAFQAAADDLYAAARFSRYAGDEPFTIGVLVEVAGRNCVYSAERSMVASAAERGAVPAAYRAFFERDLPLPSTEFAATGEASAMRQILSEVFGRSSDGALARLDVARFRDRMAMSLGKVGETPRFEVTEGMKRDAESLGYEEAVSIVTQGCDLLRLPESTPLEEVAAKNERVERLYADHPILAVVTPSFLRAIELQRELRVNRDASVIATAIFAFRDDHRRWPRTLDEALASFPVAPSDRAPYGHDFVYRIVDDAPLLYAVGRNGIDDGGRGRPFESKADGTAPGDDVLFLSPAAAAH